LTVRCEAAQRLRPALKAARLQVTLDALLTSGFTATGAGDGVVVDLTGARIGSTLSIGEARLTHLTTRIAGSHSTG